MTPEALLAACTAIHAGALMLWFGALGLQRALGLAPAPTARARWRALAAVALASGALWLALEAAVVFGEPSAALDRASVATVATQTSFGRIWLAHEALVAAALAADVAGAARAAWLLGGAGLASLGLTGHAAGAGAIDELLMAVHLLAAGAWLGALPELWVAARRLSASALGAVLRAFSRYGALLVATIVATGAWTAWRRLDTVSAIWATDYGRILVLKVALVAAMGVAALRNRNVHTPRLEGGAAQGARAALRASIAIEAAIGVLVVAVAAVLGSAESPR